MYMHGDHWKKLEVKEGHQESYETWKERRSKQAKRKASDTDTIESTDRNTLHDKKCKSEKFNLNVKLTNLNCSNVEKGGNPDRLGGGHGQVGLRADGGDGNTLAMVDATSARATDNCLQQTSRRGWENFLAERMRNGKAVCNNDLK